jgi:thiamine pyrophosphate-dependent acetolactate synthase large subunit-like protein
VLNDGACGAEVHKLRQDGLDESGAIFGSTDFGAIARGFGLRGTTIADLGQLGALMRDYDAQGTAEIWNVPISDQVTSPTMRRLKAKGHGVM